MQCCYKNDNKVDKKAYSFYVEPSNEEDTIMYLYIQFPCTSNCLIKKNPPFQIFQFMMNAYINFSISIDKRFSVKKNGHKGLNSENLSR